MKISRLTVFVFGLVATVAIQSSVHAQSSSFDKNKISTYLEKLHQENKLMGSVALDSSGQQVYAKSVGFKDRAGGQTKANTDTKYRIGSVTKMFTATMVMQLVEEHKIELSTKLSKYYPKMPNADSITVEQMLRHQSGLYNFTNAPDYSNWMTEEQSKLELLKRFRGYKPQFTPGSKTGYSNTNYVLLGFIIEDITGEPYAGQLQQRIAEPLNLESTHYGDGIDPVQNEAVSFRYMNKKWNAKTETDMSIPGGAGAIVSTPDDLTDFINALFNGKLVSEETLQKMKTTEEGFGLGLMKIPFHDSFAYGHNGGIDGFRAHLSYFPKEDVAFALTSNALNYSLNDILIGTLNIYFDKAFKIPSFNKSTITLNHKQKQKYIGNYSSDQLPMEIKLFIKDSVLKAQPTGQRAFPLKATNKTTLRFDQAGVTMKFDSLAGNKYLEFILKQAGGKYLFERK